MLEKFVKEMDNFILLFFRNSFTKNLFKFKESLIDFKKLV